MTHIRTTRILVLLAMACAALILLYNDVKGQPVIFSVETDRGNDTMYVGEPSRLSFVVDGQGATLQGLVYPLELHFSGISPIGTSPDPASIEFMPQSAQFFVPAVIPPWDHLKGLNPDTLVVGFTVFGGPLVTTGPMFIWGIVFQPQDTGQMAVDTIFLPPANHLAALDPGGVTYPLEWHADPITVLPCPNVLGDVNQDGVVTSSDIIELVMCIFKCGPGFFDVLDLGNVDCGPTTTTADVIRLVNYVFKGLDLPFCCIVLD